MLSKKIILKTLDFSALMCDNMENILEAGRKSCPQTLFQQTIITLALLFILVRLT